MQKQQWKPCIQCSYQDMFQSLVFRNLVAVTSWLLNLFVHLPFNGKPMEDWSCLKPFVPWMIDIASPDVYRDASTASAFANIAQSSPLFWNCTVSDPPPMLLPPTKGLGTVRRRLKREVGTWANKRCST